MRNLKKLTAILLVSAMCIGTAFTSFAADVVDAAVADGGSPAGKPSEGEQPGTDNKPQLPDMGENDLVARDKDGNAVVVRQDEITDEKVIETLSSQEGLKEVLGTKYQVGAKDQVVVIASGELKVDGEMPEGGLDFAIDVNGNGVNPGDTLYVLHKKADGTWEVFAVVVKEDGSVEFHLDSLSPVALVKVMSDGSVKVLSEKTETITSEKKSPKTGE